MNKQFSVFVALLIALLLSLTAPAKAQRQGPGNTLVFKDRVLPYWFANNTRFWYRNDLRDGAKEFILVDAVGGTRQPAFDHTRLAASLSRAAGQEFTGDKLPFSTIAFSEDSKALLCEAAGKSWRCDLSSYDCTPAPTPYTTPDPPRRESPAQSKGIPLNEEQPGEQLGGRGRPVTSPDGKWSAVVRENNVVVKAMPDGQEFALSQDGAENKAYGRLQWSPDSQRLIGWRIEPGERKDVYLIRFAGGPCPPYCSGRNLQHRGVAKTHL